MCRDDLSEKKCLIPLKPAVLRVQPKNRESQGHSEFVEWHWLDCLWHGWYHSPGLRGQKSMGVEFFLSVFLSWSLKSSCDEHTSTELLISSHLFHQNSFWLKRRVDLGGANSFWTCVDETWLVGSLQRNVFLYLVHPYPRKFGKYVVCCPKKDQINVQNAYNLSSSRALVHETKCLQSKNVQFTNCHFRWNSLLFGRPAWQVLIDGTIGFCRFFACQILERALFSNFRCILFGGVMRFSCKGGWHCLQNSAVSNAPHT